MNCILLEPEEAHDSSITLSGRRAEHILGILKAQVGQVLRIGQVNGPMGEGEIKAVSEADVTLDLRWGTVPPRPRDHVLLAMPRPKVMERLWNTLAQMGVASIRVTNANRVERYYFDSRSLDPTCVQERLRERLEQAVCTHLPEVSIHKRLTRCLEDDLVEGPIRLLADPPAEESLDQVWSRLAPAPEREVLIAIGPEGGWNAHERELFAAHGFASFHMGRRIFRTETALVTALSQLDAIRRTGA